MGSNPTGGCFWQNFIFHLFWIETHQSILTSNKYCTKILFQSAILNEQNFYCMHNHHIFANRNLHNIEELPRAVSVVWVKRKPWVQHDNCVIGSTLPQSIISQLFLNNSCNVNFEQKLPKIFLWDPMHRFNWNLTEQQRYIGRVRTQRKQCRLELVSSYWKLFKLSFTLLTPTNNYKFLATGMEETPAKVSKNLYL